MIFIDSQHLPIGLHLFDGVAFVWSKSDERTLKHFMFSNLFKIEDNGVTCVFLKE